MANELESLEKEKDGLGSLGILTFLRSYSKDGKENYAQTVERYLQFWRDKYPTLIGQINGYGQALHEKAVVPSMRMFQFAGEAVEKANARSFNCCYLGIEDFKDFADMCYLLACGCGVGVSVQKEYVDAMPAVQEGHEYSFVVPDTKEGWADSFQMLCENPKLRFDYGLVRPAGAPISSGGTASGPGPLMEAHAKIRAILSARLDKHLRPIDVADITCLIAQAIVSGGSRRSAIIILFSSDDAEMLNYKQGNWWDENPQRMKANISSVSNRNTSETEGRIDALFMTKFGEPGLILQHKASNKENTGGNPCLEISLRSRQMCNLTEIISPNLRSESDFLFACRAAAFFGTLQASLTNFTYIKPEWKKDCDEDALLGVSITGCAQAPKFVTKQLLREGALEVIKQNQTTAKKIGINPAKRLTCVKPSGSTSCVMGTASGIHAAHGEYVIRRVRVTKLSLLAQSLIAKFGISDSENAVTEHGTFILPTDKYSFIVHEAYSDKDIVLQFPCHYQNAIYRKNESAVELLERMAEVYENWVKPGHIEGQETNNVSITVSYKPEEVGEVSQWMKDNQDKYRGISVLPDDCTAYPLLPFEEVSKEEWLKYYERFPVINWEVFGISSNASGSSACSGGGCEVNSL
jgi:ribonucleoside-diphosphate reductase alpha chain